MGESVFNIDWTLFHFLRPDWFWAGCALPFIALVMVIKQRHRSGWKKAFNRVLLDHLRLEGSSKQFWIPNALLLLGIVFLSLAMAGPTWKKVDTPGNKSEAEMVILLDMSRSMLVEDIRPSRVERAKLKLKDLFSAQPKVATALCVYAGTAHQLVPFTKDYRAIEQQMEAVKPEIMPVQGSNLEEALDVADSLLQPNQAPSTILIVTDNVEASSLQRLEQSASRNSIEIMTLGTPMGGTIPLGSKTLKDGDGNEVNASLDVTSLKQAGQLENVDVVTVTLDQSDVKILANRIRENMTYILDDEDKSEGWNDFGYWLLLPCLLMNLIWFRRGWMVQWVFLALIVSSCEWTRRNEVFYTADQQASRLLDQGDTNKAAEIFNRADWKAKLYYELGSSDTAIQLLLSDPTAENFYNAGVLLTEQGDLGAAVEVFRAASELDPTLSLAQRNLELVSMALDSLQSADSVAFALANQRKTNPTKFSEYAEQPDEHEKAQQSDETYEGKGDVQEMVTKEVNEDDLNFFNFDESMTVSKDQAQQTLLRQVNDDPSIFIRRKFAHQVKNRKTKIKDLDPW